MLLNIACAHTSSHTLGNPVQQHTGESTGGQLHVPESEVQRRLLAQLSSRPSLKPGPKPDSTGLSSGMNLGQEVPAGVGALLQNPIRAQQQQQQQQQMIAELV